MSADPWADVQAALDRVIQDIADSTTDPLEALRRGARVGELVGAMARAMRPPAREAATL